MFPNFVGLPSWIQIVSPFKNKHREQKTEFLSTPKFLLRSEQKRIIITTAFL